MKKVLITLILLATIALGFYLYSKQALDKVKGQIVPTPHIDENEKPRQSSEHARPEKIEIKGTDEYRGEFSKEIFLPKIINLSNKTVVDSINKELGFESVIGESIEELKKSASGITAADYEVTYDKNDILSLDLYIDFMGPYPSIHHSNYNFNLNTGKHIELSDIFYKEKISTLVKMLNLKLSANIKGTLAWARENNPDSRDGECDEDDINYQIDGNKQYDSNYGQFNEQKLDYLITSAGIQFHYNFDFPHVILACEPAQLDVMTFKELRDYIHPDGLLGNEIK